jgi:predicted TIM-barrel fold metal-dependent hydrolase
VQEKLAASIGHLSDELRHKVLWGNAAKVYGIRGPAAA